MKKILLTFSLLILLCNIGLAQAKMGDLQTGKYYKPDPRMTPDMGMVLDFTIFDHPVIVTVRRSNHHIANFEATAEFSKLSDAIEYIGAMKVIYSLKEKDCFYNAMIDYNGYEVYHGIGEEITISCGLNKEFKHVVKFEFQSLSLSLLNKN